MTETSEKELVLALKTLRETRKKLEADLEQIRKEENNAESLLIDHLESLGASQTAHFDGLGHATLSKPRIYASYTEENAELMKQYLMRVGREDMLKEKVNPSTLSAYVAELIEEGKEIPPFVSYYFKNSIRIY